MSVPGYWFLRTIEQTQIPGGFTIVTTSDGECHQWLRHSLIVPAKHLKPVFRRGLLMSYDARFCFVVFEDIEQDEAGDTTTHTFTWLGWEDCQTRYFYFWATYADIPMKSTSCIFSKHFTYIPVPTTLYFYSDKQPEVTSVDGRTDRLWLVAPYDFWPQMRDGPGTASFDNITTGQLDLRCSGIIGKYYWLRRTIHLFDTSVIPPGSTILEASLSIIRNTAANNFTVKPSLGVYASNPASNIALVPADYNAYSSTLLSSVIDYDTFAASVGPHEMVLNAAGLASIIPGGITKLAIRDATRDGPNNDIWEANKSHALVFWAADAALPANRPVLMVKFL